jgi:hypothetical protein
VQRIAAQGGALVLLALAVWQLSAAAANADTSPAAPASVPMPARSGELVRDVTETSGLAIGVSFPTGAGLIGVRADYLFQLPRTLFRFGVHAGVGAFLCVDPDCHPSYSFGALGSWGHHHRLFLEVLTGTLGGATLQLHGQNVASRALWGVGSEIGYEYMGEGGFFIRFGAGIAMLVEPAILPLSERIGPALTLLHVGCKLW